MTERFAVLNEKREVIEGHFSVKREASRFASDYRAVFKCRLPTVVSTLRALKPGYKVCPDDLA
jgi:hypothetical protein